MIESITKAGVVFGGMLGLTLIASGNPKVGAVIAIVSGFSWLICTHLDKLAIAVRKQTEQETERENTQGMRDFKARSERKVVEGKPRQYGMGLRSSPGSNTSVEVQAKQRIDDDYAQVKAACFEPSDINESIKLVLNFSATLITPLLTYPGHEMKDPKTKKKITPIEASDMVTENFRHVIHELIKYTARGMEKGEIPNTIEECEEWEKKGR